MQNEAAVTVVWILIEVIDPIRVKQGTAALYSMDFVSLREQQLGKIRSILPGDTGD
jgi:hypothetical protein